jgi:hypothetical protein
MIYDQRTYTCRPGTIKKHMALYAEHGWKTQTKHLGTPLLYSFVETGNLNSFVHIWWYYSVEDRASKRSALAADPTWIDYLKLSAAAVYLSSQVNQILVPTNFFNHPIG